MQHMFTFIVPMSSIKSPLSQHDSVPKTFSQRTFSKLGQTSSSTFLHIRKENISCIVCCEVFLLRVVLGFVGGGEEMVYVFPFSLDQLSSSCPLHTTTSIPQIPLRVWDRSLFLSRRNLVCENHPLSLDFT